MLGKLLIAYGAAVLALLYLGAATVAVADAYGRAGVGGMMVAVVLATALPAVALGLVLMDR